MKTRQFITYFQQQHREAYLRSCEIELPENVLIAWRDRAAYCYKMIVYYRGY